jgi:hypothetical protein
MSIPTDREKMLVALEVSAAITGAKIIEADNFIDVKGIRRFYFNTNGNLIKVEDKQAFHRRVV